MDRIVFRTTFVLLVLLLTTSISNANIFQSKDWSWGSDNERFLYAATVNADNQSFGQYCYLDSKVCVYLLNTGIVCREGSELTALINSDKGSKEVTLLCRMNSSGDSVYMLVPFNLIDVVARQASYFAIAIPTNQADFQIARFSLIGSTYAIELMLSATKKIIDIQELGKRDEILL